MVWSRNMMGFFLRKDMRKLLKRKDSDATQTGKSLENLRASIFSELHTSEGAKRLQQRVCGPAVSLSFNFFISVAIIMLNKLVLEKVGFNYPIFLTFIHYALSWFLMSIMNILSLLPASPPAKSTPYFFFLLALGFVMSLSNGLANISLQLNSVGFYQMAKIAVTPTIVLAEFIFLRKTVSFMKVLLLCIVSVGVAIATVTDIQFNFTGACVALAWIVPSAINKILWSHLQQHYNWTALALMWKTTPTSLLFLVTLMWFDRPGARSFKCDAQNSAVILLSAVFGFFLQFSGALALGATSATSHVVLGQFKTCVILLGAFVVFGSNPGTTSICGAITAITGMTIYTYLNLLDSRQLTSKGSLRPSSFSFLKSKLRKENDVAHDENCPIEIV